MAKFIYLDGTPGTYASTPHSAAVDITGDLTVVAHIAPALWQWSGGAQYIGAKGVTLTNAAWAWRLESAGWPALYVFGATTPRQTFTAPRPLLEPGEPLWLATAVTLDNGAGQSIGKHYQSVDGVTWLEVGSTENDVIDAIASTSHAVAFGATSAGGAALEGKIYRAQIYSGAGFDLSGGPTGTLVADFNLADAPDYARGGDSFQSTLTGETWTLHGNASIGEDHPLAISDEMVLEPKLPRPSVCLTAMARREVRLQAVWRQCR